MSLLAKWFSLALVLASLIQGPRTLQIQNDDKKAIDADIIIQTLPGRETIYTGKTTKGELTLPDKLLDPYAKGAVLILVSPIEAEKYVSRRKVGEVRELLKGPLVIDISKRRR